MLGVGLVGGAVGSSGDGVGGACSLGEDCVGVSSSVDDSVSGKG